MRSLSCLRGAPDSEARQDHDHRQVDQGDEVGTADPLLDPEAVCLVLDVELSIG